MNGAIGRVSLLVGARSEEYPRWDGGVNIVLPLVNMPTQKFPISIMIHSLCLFKKEPNKGTEKTKWWTRG